MDSGANAAKNFTRVALLATDKKVTFSMTKEAKRPISIQSS
jgi:hypothetical protein